MCGLSLHFCSTQVEEVVIVYTTCYPQFSPSQIKTVSICPTAQPVTRDYTHTLHSHSHAMGSDLLVLQLCPCKDFIVAAPVLLQLSMCFPNNDVLSLWLSKANPPLEMIVLFWSLLMLAVSSERYWRGQRVRCFLPLNLYEHIFHPTFWRLPTETDSFQHHNCYTSNHCAAIDYYSTVISFTSL